VADKRLMIDTSVLIEYFRVRDKTNSRLVAHFRSFDQLFISAVTEFEIFNGASRPHQQFWVELVSRLVVLPFDSQATRESTNIVSALKTKRKSIDKPDLFIAATAIVHDLPLDTHNVRHFRDIEALRLVLYP